MFGQKCVVLMLLAAVPASVGCFGGRSGDVDSQTHNSPDEVGRYFNYIWRRADRLEVTRMEVSDPAIKTSKAIIANDNFKTLSKQAVQDGIVGDGRFCKTPFLFIHYRIVLFNDDRAVAVLESNWPSAMHFENTCDREVFIPKEAEFWSSLTRLIDQYCASNPDSVSVREIETGKPVPWPGKIDSRY